MKMLSFEMFKKIKIIFVLSLCLPILSMAMDKVRDSKETKRLEYWQTKKLLEPMGYVVERPDASTGDFRISFPAISRSPRETESLYAWRFTDNDIQRLTIRNIYDPLSDERIRAANRPDIDQSSYRFTPRIFASHLLWPNIYYISEADMLLLIPWVLQSGDDINLRLPARTLFHIAVTLDYQRVVQLLLSYPNIDVHLGDGEETPLGTALDSLDSRSLEIVRLILERTDNTLPRNWVKLVDDQPEKKALLEKYLELSALNRKEKTRETPQANALRESLRKKFGPFNPAEGVAVATGVSSTDVPVKVPMPDKLLAKYAKMHADFKRAAQKRGDNIPVEPPHRPIKSLIAWSISVPIVAAIIKYGNDFYEKYYSKEKIGSQSKTEKELLPG